MTYKELVNNVLRRLRKDTISSYSDSDYSTMVGDFVNDAMDICQNAWNWSHLMEELTVNTVASTQTATLEGIGEGGQVYQVRNATNTYMLSSRPAGWMKMQTSLSGNAEGAPYFWAFNSVETDGDMTIDLYPIPDAVYSLAVYVKKQQAAMTSDTDVLLIPAQPVIQMAYAFALEERGDTGGGNNMTQMARAQQVLSDYIQLDQQKHPETLVWTTL